MRNRNMYYATGLPGWMRFGYSPGWIGRSPTGLGPCAQYLLTGQAPWLGGGASMGQVPFGGGVGGGFGGGFGPMGQGPWGGGMGFVGAAGAGGFQGAAGPMGFQGVASDKATRLQFLRGQAEVLARQLEALRAQIDAVENEA